MSVRGFLLACVIIAVVCSCAGADGPHVRLKYADFDPLAGEPAMSSDLRLSPASGESEWFIVQFDGPIVDAWKDSLRAMGAGVDEYVPDFAFLVSMTPELAAKVRRLEHVRWVGPYHAAYRIDKRLSAAPGSIRANLTLFRGDSADQAEAEIRKRGGVTNRLTLGGRGAHIDATLPVKGLGALARVRGVKWIEPKSEYHLFNNIARGILDVNTLWSTTGFYGNGEIVCVADTGLDTGVISTLSADFAGRLLKVYTLGRKGAQQPKDQTGTWSDTHGHGTHVAGSVLGAGVLSGSNPAAHNYTTSFAGTAPEAQLIFQSLLDSSGGLGGIPADITQLFAPPYADGARIHTNSWGASVAGAYDTDAHNVDVFTWNNQDMTILFAAGNDGIDGDSNGVVDPGSMGSPGTAKNCITVGATENYRLTGGYQGKWGTGWPTKFPADPIKNDYPSNNSGGMAAFSGRGPTDDGRIKPDVVAPGTNILSCRSHVAAGTGWGVYDSNYMYNGGTSMATPLVAGIAAHVRNYYRTQRAHVPTSALMKATLINTATDVYPGQYGTGSFQEIPTTRPNNVEGWGLVNPSYAIPASGPRKLEYIDNTSGVSTGGSEAYSFEVYGSTSPLRVTLVWTDYPGYVGAAKALVNDLDLVVTLPGGATMRGNGTTDRYNNVEGVDIANPAAGTYTVAVNGYNVPSGSQPFAVVVTSDTPPPPTATISAPASGTLLAGLVGVRGTASGVGFQQYVLDYGAGAAPSSWLPIGSAQTVPPTEGLLGAWDTSQLADGLYTIRLAVTGSSGTSTSQVTVQLARVSVSFAKEREDGGEVVLTGKVVTAGASEFAGCIYVQEPDRVSGIRANPISLPPGVAIGSVVTVTGTLHTVSGERVVDSATVVVTGP